MDQSELYIRPKQSKVILSGLLNLAFFIILAIIINRIIFNISLSNNYHQLHSELITIQDTYKIETGYGEKIYLNSLNEQEFSKYHVYTDEGGRYVVNNLNQVNEEIEKSFSNKLKNDSVYQETLKSFQFNSFSLLTLVIGVSQGVFFLVVPLCNKNRATFGQMIFGLKIINYRNKKPINPLIVIVRFLIIFIFESLLPYILFGEIVLLFMPLILIAVTLFSNDNRTIHDFITYSLPSALKLKPLFVEVSEYEQ